MKMLVLKYKNKSVGIEIENKSVGIKKYKTKSVVVKR